MECGVAAAAATAKVETMSKRGRKRKQQHHQQQQLQLDHVSSNTSSKRKKRIKHTGGETHEQQEHKKKMLKKLSKKMKKRKGSFSFYRDEQDARAAGFIYRKMWVIDIPLLAEDTGLRLLQNLGLLRFANLPPPHLDKNLCDQFLSTLDLKTGCGTVNGKQISLDMHSVSEATGLPLGDTCIASFMSSGKQMSALKRLLPDYKDKTTRGFDLGGLMYDEEEVHAFQTIASLLMVKLECKKECFQFVSAEVLLGLDQSLRTGEVLNWADYLANLMFRAAASLIRREMTSSIGYQFGEWLTKIIQDGVAADMLPITDGATDGDTKVDNEMEDANQVDDVVKMLTEPEPVTGKADGLEMLGIAGDVLGEGKVAIKLPTETGAEEDNGGPTETGAEEDNGGPTETQGEGNETEKPAQVEEDKLEATESTPEDSKEVEYHKLLWTLLQEENRRLKSSLALSESRVEQLEKLKAEAVEIVTLFMQERQKTKSQQQQLSQSN